MCVFLLTNFEVIKQFLTENQDGWAGWEDNQAADCELMLLYCQIYAFHCNVALFITFLDIHNIIQVSFSV